MQAAVHSGILLLCVFVVSCGGQESFSRDGVAPTRTRQDSTQSDAHMRARAGNRPAYHSAADIVRDNIRSVWAESRGEAVSLSLHFAADTPDTLSVSYSPECWLEFPYRVKDDRIIVYWDLRIDSKYEFEFVRAVRQADRRYLGKPFMVLTLLNDTTLRAAYPIPSLAKALNDAGDGRTLWPETFSRTQIHW
jgi:hypothetical protein